MPVATSLAQLNQQMMQAVRAAMMEANYMAMGDMHEGTEVFYGGGSPIRYVRTGKLGSTPRTTGVTSSVGGSGGMASFRAYLDQGGAYTTGKRPSMATVLDLANYGGVKGMRPTVGVKGFWEYSEELME